MTQPASSFAPVLRSHQCTVVRTCEHVPYHDENTRPVLKTVCTRGRARVLKRAEACRALRPALVSHALSRSHHVDPGPRNGSGASPKGLPRLPRPRGIGQAEHVHHHELLKAQGVVRGGERRDAARVVPLHAEEVAED